MNPTGKKQIKEAVAIAALCTLVSGVVQGCIDVVRSRMEIKKRKRKKRKGKPE